MKAYDLIHGGLYLIGESQIVRYNALDGGFYTLDGDFFGSSFADADSGEIECFTINQNWLKISPIPLTPEILEKNGLDKVPELSMVINRDTMPMYHSPMLHYVHELQRALRLCGLNELAKNFKVE